MRGMWMSITPDFDLDLFGPDSSRELSVHSRQAHAEAIHKLFDEVASELPGPELAASEMRRFAAADGWLLMGDPSQIPPLRRGQPTSYLEPAAGFVAVGHAPRARVGLPLDEVLQALSKGST